MGQPVSLHSDHLNEHESRLEQAAKRLVVLIPALNEEQALGAALADLRAVLPHAELLVINDGSSDSTGAIARDIPDVRLLSHRQTQGYGASLKTGVRQSRRDFIAWFDADGQHRAEDLLRVLETMVATECDAVIGVRDKKSHNVLMRKPGKRILRWLVNFVAGEQIPDVNSGLRCIRRSILEMYLHLLPNGFSASTTSTLVLLKRGYHVEYCPITVAPRLGTSSVSIIRDGARTLALILRIVVLFDALRIFSAVGGALFLLGATYGVYIASSKGLGLPTLAMLLCLSGLIVFCVGLVADQVTALRKERFEVSRLPQR